MSVLQTKNLMLCFVRKEYCFWYKNGTNKGKNTNSKVYHMSLPRVNNLENLCNSLSSGDTVSSSTTIFVDEVS